MVRSRADAFYEKTVAELGYRISPRLPFEYRLGRLIQRIFDSSRPEKLTLAEATMMGQLCQLSINGGFETETVYADKIRGEPPQILLTRLRGYPDGGVSIRRWQKTQPHHPMRLRSRPRRLRRTYASQETAREAC